MTFSLIRVLKIDEAIVPRASVLLQEAGGFYDIESRIRSISASAVPWTTARPDVRISERK